MTPKTKLLTFLKKNNITFTEHFLEEQKFPPDPNFWTDRKILRCKNLFFRDNHGKNHYLVVFNYSKKINLKKLKDIIGRGSMTMASSWRLEKYLGLKPGFISIFGLLNDEKNHVKVIIDKELDQKKELSFLPNTEGGSFVSFNFNGLIKFLEATGNEYKIEKVE